MSDAPHGLQGSTPGGKAVTRVLVDPVVRVAQWIEVALAAALCVAVALNFTNVVGRYLFGLAFSAADETQVYLLVCMAFVGAAVVSVHQMHLRMDVILQSFAPGIRKALRVVELLMIIGLCGLVTVQSFSYVSQMYTLEAVSDNAHIPMWIPHMSVTLGFSLMALAALIQLVRLLTGREMPAPEGPAEDEVHEGAPELQTELRI